ncbi:hypothetical protein CC1G_15021 [Coprinopsis cinerea okayama7|uniref:Uncharacterized protein n=1 Tax=Coprinopsis cinerea (strain Okayama-7 / 130 / ATCC MYA-4618 / FGSC 9003) TaxID=240176 RepID=D6RPC8_COPC7|nr:hypothetical protein CC1G_15021 [Coprinopsis cinerea okayama7\|eukprot:XP_002910690.1 hypothetical protein CC1G_15021 [Coprinopsis cinerea okayama7\
MVLEKRDSADPKDYEATLDPHPRPPIHPFSNCNPAFHPQESLCMLDVCTMALDSQYFEVEFQVAAPRGQISLVVVFSTLQ